MPDIRLTRAEENGRLPNVCMCCGAPASAYVEKSFPLRPPTANHPSGSVLTAIQVLVSAAKTPHVGIRTSFCPAHRNYWKWRFALNYGGLAGLFAVVAAGVAVAMLVLFVAKIDAPWVSCCAIGPLVAYLAVWITAAKLVADRTIRVRAADDGTDALVLLNVDARYAEALLRQRGESPPTGGGPTPPPTAILPTASLVGAAAAPPAPRSAPAEPESAPRAPRAPRAPNPGVAVISTVLAVILGACVLIMCVVRIGRTVDWMFRQRAEEHQAAAPREAGKPPQAQAHPQPQVQPLGEKERDGQPVLAVAGAPPHPALPAALEGKASIDLIPLMQPRKDIVHGRWGVVGDELHCPDKHNVPRVQFPYEPPAEYDFVVTFWQPGLRNGISLIMPKPDGGGCFFWYVGGEDGHSYGFAANPNKGGRIRGLVQAKQSYTTTVQVRRANVRGLLDGKELLALTTDFRDLTCDNWHRIQDPKFLAVACDDPTVFQYIRVVEVSGPGRKAR